MRPHQPAANEQCQTYAPGLTVRVRDELWLVTNVAQSTDGFLLTVRGLSDFVSDTTATFYTAIDQIEVIDPSQVEVIPDHSPGFRTSRLWLETTLRRTPVPLYQKELTVAPHMLMDPLDYQLSATRKALSSENVRPRVLIADAVGLGKTLEIGMILAELIRRGRGDRILIVTPKHILEQFQQELWSRFAIPLVRLDSLGIQRVRQKLPGSRNPFTYFNRVIVSMDTLKSPKYRAQLEKVRWDAVVVDEIHNATNAGTQNNELVRAIAPTTEALLLASATPHNGNADSFREILQLLDPTSVRPNGEIDMEAAKRLIIRRHRHSPEVASVVGTKWAERAEPKNILVPASSAENAIAHELDATWLHPVNDDGESVPNPASDHLFPWTLVKAFLSSPAALDETLRNRIKSVPKGIGEEAALKRLQALNNEVTTKTSNKYLRLIDYLREIKVGPRKPTRVVIFSERVATLHWLKENLQRDLKMPKNAVAVMHGQLSDQEQMYLVDEFKRSDSKLRILVTGDVASEGVNLHTLCHDLVHYDIPWSLIRIQQRNGRVDRYGQEHAPQITTLLLDTEQGGDVGEVKVLARLMQREHEAHQVIGDVGSLMGKYSEKAEEVEIRKVLQREKNLDDVACTPDEVKSGNTEDAIAALMADIEATKTQQSDSSALLAGNSAGNDNYRATKANNSRSLYPSEIGYLQDALSEAFFGAPEKPLSANGVSFTLHKNGVAELTPPIDLQRRLDVLPQDYLSCRKVKENFQLATTRAVGEETLQRARTGVDGSTWPKAHFLGPLHPVTDWATDRALAQLSNGKIPAIEAEVDGPIVLLMGTLTNKRGQVVSRAFVTVGPPGAFPAAIPDPVAWLQERGLTVDATNPGTLTVPENSHEIISNAVQDATSQLRPMMDSAKHDADERIHRWMQHSEEWAQEKADANTHSVRASRTAQLLEREKSLIESLAPDRELVRPLVLVLPIKEA